VSPLHRLLSHAVTQYDRQQLERSPARHNIYALGHYLGRVHAIVADVERGAEPRAAILRGFTGALLRVALRAAKLPKATPDEARGDGRWCYEPVTPDPLAD